MVQLMMKFVSDPKVEEARGKSSAMKQQLN
jgi:hypothetical protein